jgi:hypothetical protein
MPKDARNESIPYKAQESQETLLMRIENSSPAILIIWMPQNT